MGFITYIGEKVACIAIRTTTRFRENFDSESHHGFYNQLGPVSPSSPQGSIYLEFLRQVFADMDIPQEMPLESITNVAEGGGAGGGRGGGSTAGVGLGGGAIKRRSRKKSKSKSKSKLTLKKRSRRNRKKKIKFNLKNIKF